MRALNVCIHYRLKTEKRRPRNELFLFTVFFFCCFSIEIERAVDLHIAFQLIATPHYKRKISVTSVNNKQFTLFFFRNDGFNLN